MKRTALSVILVLILVLSLAILPVYATETTETTESTETTHEAHPHDDANYAHCVCGGSAVGIHDHVCDGTTVWTPLSEALKAAGLSVTKANFNKLPDGNYYLDCDVVVNSTGDGNNGTGKLPNGNTPASGTSGIYANINLCLNGYAITTSASRVFAGIKETYTLSICDCSGVQDAEGNWSWNGSVTSGAGSTADDKKYGGIIYTNSGSVFNVYGGNFRSSGNQYTGGLFVVGNDGCTVDWDGDGKLEARSADGTDDMYHLNARSQMNIYNGDLKGGAVHSAGGAIYVYHNAILNIHGGKIYGGSAMGFTNSSGTLTGGNGGNIGIDQGTLNITGGLIEGGVSTQTGGNIYASSKATINISSGTISGGTAGTSGGSIYGSSATATVSGSALITKGTATNNNGGNLYVKNLTISSGTISDGTSKGAGGNIYSTSGYKLTITGGTISGGTATASNGGNIGLYAGGSSQTTTISGCTISGGKANGGCNIYATTTGDNTTGKVTITIKSGTISGGVTKSGTHGGNIRINDADCTLYIGVKDSATGPSISGGTATKSYGGNIYAVGAVYVYSGTISGGTGQRGGNINSSAALNISGGTIKDGKATSEESGNGGGNIYNTSSTVTISGGTISKGNAAMCGGNIYAKTLVVTGGIISEGTSKDTGGNIFAGSGSNVTISGGTIQNGKSTGVGGGNLALYANTGSHTTLISGGIIKDGIAQGTGGGNIYLSTNADNTTGKVTLTITGGTISGGTAKKGYNGGSIRANDAECFIIIGTEGSTDGPMISGGKASGTSASGGSGGNICHHTGHLTIHSGTITGGITDSAHGGNIYVKYLTMTGGTIENGQAQAADASGGNIYITNNSTITGGIIRGGQAGFNGGNLYHHGGTLTIEGQVTISGGTCGNRGGNVYFVKAATVQNGVQILDGTATSDAEVTTNGGNIYAATTINLTNITVSGGKAHHGGNISLSGGTCNLIGCTISDGHANLMLDGTTNGNGGNIYSMSGATTTISGCTITGGEARRAGSVGVWGNVTIENTTIDGGTAHYAGGCIMTYGGGQLTLNAGTVLKNGKAKTEVGAAIHYGSNAGEVQIINSGVTISDGTAPTGKGISVGSGTLSIVGDPTFTSLYVSNSKSAAVVDLTQMTTTGVSLSGADAGEIATGTEANLAQLTNPQGYTLTYKDGKLYLIAPAAVYVSASGSDDGLGTPAAPFGTLDHAMHIVDNNGTIHIVGTVKSEDSPAKQNKIVTITGDELILPETRFYLNNNTTFDDLTLTMSLCTDPTQDEYLSYYFYCNGFTTVFTESVQTRFHNGTEYVSDAINTYKEVDSEGKEITKQAYVWLYGGCNANSANTKITSTNLTVLGGRWGYIMGGNNAQVLNGDVHLTVGGKVNEGVDYVNHVNSSKYMILGGSRAADINGTVYMNVTGGTHTSTFGGSIGSQHVDHIVLTVTGGEGMAIYGGGRGGAQTVDTIDFHYEGGTFEQVFGGCLSQCLTGDVNLWVTGGNITRRVYGGCYSNCDESSGQWTADNFVTGNVRLLIGEGANIPCNLKDPSVGLEIFLTGGLYADRGIYGHSRRAAPSATDAENSAIIFLTQAAYEANKGNLTAQDTIMATIMNGISAADVICYLEPWTVGTDSISANAVAVKDPETKTTGDASAYSVRVYVENEEPYTFVGEAIIPQVITEGTWLYGEVNTLYADNTAPGTGTVTVTVPYANGTFTTTFQIKDGKVATVGSTAYYSFQEALDAVPENGYIKLYMGTNADLHIDRTMYLDLNGCTVTGTITLADGATLYGMDASTNDYDCSDGYGTLLVQGGTVAAHHKTNASGAILRYLTHTNETTGEVSFHRIYLGIVKTSLKPSVSGVGYRAVFGGDKVVQDMLSETEAFGYGLWLTDTADQAVEETAKYKVFADRNRFTTGKEVSLRLQNFNIAAAGEKYVNAEVYLKLADGTVIDSSDYSYTLKDMLTTVNSNVAKYTESQMQSLQTMCQPYADTLTAWGLTDILNWTPKTEEPTE